MPATVFIGDIAEDTRRDDIEDFLEKSKYARGRYDGIRMRRRFGFVDFQSSRDADDFIRDMEGERLLGHRVRLEIADALRGRGGRGGRSRRDSRSRSRGRDRGRDRPHRTKYCLEIDNLSSRINWADLKDLFRKVGEVTYTDANQRLGRNRGEVCFENRDDMNDALKKYNGYELNGREMKITLAEEKKSRSKSRSRSRSRSRGRRSRRHRSRSSRGRSSSASRSRSRSGTRSRSGSR